MSNTRKSWSFKKNVYGYANEGQLNNLYFELINMEQWISTNNLFRLQKAISS